MRSATALLCVVAISCATARMVRPDGTRLECVAFGQSRARACEVAGSLSGSPMGAIVLGPCCEADGGAVSAETGTMTKIAIGAVVTILTAGVALAVL